ncbi:hypothetical protein CCAX7_44380 [Capsulimonas corticalis]|uniref:Uncharacterized protein n=1 Tax=Capsulimonas corticalis TaxID=2219043 RepID=A0A402CX76_9BACT|nr:hypothetical protein [Capsulimonas corticalis]BDI32387.1 hypothetical protein CCAX7_44380 [Capsulimonas corticalis]
MKNGTQSNKLTLVDKNGEEIPVKASVDDLSVEYIPGESESKHDSSVNNVLNNKVLFVVVSVACATAAVAAGSYAVWLSRRKVAQEALTNVQDLLETCQDRMSQMEQDLNNITQRHSQSTA